MIETFYVICCSSQEIFFSNTAPPTTESIKGMYIRTLVLTRDDTLTRHFHVPFQSPSLTRLVRDRSLDSQSITNQLTSQFMHTGPICTFRLPGAETKAVCWFPPAARILSRNSARHARQTHGWFTMFHKSIQTGWYCLMENFPHLLRRNRNDSKTKRK